MERRASSPVGLSLKQNRRAQAITSHKQSNLEGKSPKGVTGNIRATRR